MYSRCTAFTCVYATLCNSLLGILNPQHMGKRFVFEPFDWQFFKEYNIKTSNHDMQKYLLFQTFGRSSQIWKVNGFSKHQSIQNLVRISQNFDRHQTHLKCLNTILNEWYFWNLVLQKEIWKKILRGVTLERPTAIAQNALEVCWKTCQFEPSSSTTAYYNGSRSESWTSHGPAHEILQYQENRTGEELMSHE